MAKRLRKFKRLQGLGGTCAKLSYNVGAHKRGWNTVAVKRGDKIVAEIHYADGTEAMIDFKEKFSSTCEQQILTGAERAVTRRMRATKTLPDGGGWRPRRRRKGR